MRGGRRVGPDVLEVHRLGQVPCQVAHDVRSWHVCIQYVELFHLERRCQGGASSNHSGHLLLVVNHDVVGLIHHQRSAHALGLPAHHHFDRSPQSGRSHWLAHGQPFQAAHRSRRSLLRASSAFIRLSISAALPGGSAKYDWVAARSRAVNNRPISWRI